VSADPPDILLVDLGLPDGDGLDLIRYARAHSPHTRSMVITVFGDEASTIRAIEAGARGYILKSELPEDLRSTIEQLLAGGAPISPAIASHLLRRLGPPAEPADPAAGGPVLSPREREVLQLVVRGLSYQEIADVLSISRHTATSHIRNIYRKLEVRSRSEASYEALRLGIVDIKDLP
jgi:DNA-binding NarL/FixJ family response regulator